MKELTKEDTNILKGISLLLLLFHHLFYEANGLYSDITIGDTGIVCEVGKVVNIFLCAKGNHIKSRGRQLPPSAVFKGFLL